jgi:DNA-binding transcriptional regulator LsrR (DeoR family)
MSATAGEPAPDDRWGPARRLLAADVADRYFIAGQTKITIAAELGLSRFQVARLLDAARERGLVRVEIDAGPDVDRGRSGGLRAAYGLRRALVVPPGPARSVPARVAALAADLLRETVGTGDVLGLAWSRTVNDVVEHLHRLPRCQVVQLCGAYSLPWRRDGSATAVYRAAALCGGDAFPIYAPLVLPDRDSATAVRSQPGVADAVARFAELGTAVVSVGAWRTGHSTVHDVLTAAERKRLGGRGACGEIVGLLVDHDGRVLDTPLAQHVVAVGEAELRAAREVVALVRDPERADAVDAVLRSGLVHTLVADAGTADALLRLAAERPVPGA